MFAMMMNMGMSVYAVYEKNSEYVFVREGFSLLACVFTGIWSIVQRQWLILLLLIVSGFVVHYLGAMNIVNAPFVTTALNISLGLFCGFAASDLEQRRLHKKGYAFVHAVVASSQTEAELKFYNNCTSSETKRHLLHY